MPYSEWKRIPPCVELNLFQVGPSLISYSETFMLYQISAQNLQTMPYSL